MSPLSNPEDLRALARALADDLAGLVAEYPTDDLEVTPVVLARFTVAGQEVGAVPLQPGHLDWLRRLIAAEAETTANKHSDRPEHCGHCHDTGKAPRAPGLGRSATNPADPAALPRLARIRS